MDERQIRHLLFHDPYTRPLVRGVCPRDHLPGRLTWHVGDPPQLYVVNWDPAYRPGSHWVALYLHPTQRGEYFDSYGLPPLPECQRLLNQCRQWTYNTRRLQEDTLVCGQYCVLFLMLRSRGRSFDQIIDALLRPDHDSLVHAFVQQYYPSLPFR